MKEIFFSGIGLAIVALLALLAYQNYTRHHTPQITTRYQAVTLVNGEVIYGRIAHLGSDHPILRDAFAVLTEEDPQTRRPRSVIVKRRDGATGADHLIFPATAIAFVEPVQPDSPIGRLIGQADPGR